MRRPRVLAMIAVVLAATLAMVTVSPSAASAAPRPNAIVLDANYAPYPDGVVVTFNKWDTGVIGASAAFTAVWVAAAALGGQLGNKVYQSIWYIQAIAAYDGATGQCLWVWVPKDGKVNAGGYRC